MPSATEDLWTSFKTIKDGKKPTAFFYWRLMNANKTRNKMNLNENVAIMLNDCDCQIL